MPAPDIDRRGIRDAAKAALDSGMDYARARSELAKIEAAEAARKLRTISVLAGAGGALLLSGYVLLLFLACRWAADTWLGGDWRIPVAVVATAHILAGGILLIAARSRARRARFFNCSIQQLEQDQQWLQKTRSKLKNRR
jgi:hypothetical protein